MTKRILVPRDLDGKARDLWHDTLSILRDRAEPPLVPETDLPWLEQYCRSHMQARHALKRILDREAFFESWTSAPGEKPPPRGWTAYGAQGQLVQHPDVKTMDAALKHANDVARELLLPPRTRKQHEIQSKAGDKDDPFS